VETIERVVATTNCGCRVRMEVVEIVEDEMVIQGGETTEPIFLAD